jgi:SSS family solute:Na+ symporter
LKSIKLVEAIHSEDEQAINTARTNVQAADKKSNAIRKEATALMQKNNPKADVNDTNYIFLNFITTQLPIGVVGLLIAIIFLASMGSMASGLNSLASTTIIDFYKRLFKKEESRQILLIGIALDNRYLGFVLYYGCFLCQPSW